MARPKKVVKAQDESLGLGRTSPSWTTSMDWIAFAVSPEAHSYWVKLRMHLNHIRGDSVVYPGKERMGLLMRVSRGDGTDRWKAELEAVGAMENLGPQTMGGTNRYVLHDEPPPGYTGPLTLKQWGIMHAGELDRRRDAAADRTRLQRRRDLLHLNATKPERLPAWLIENYGEPTPEEWAVEHRAELVRRATEQAKRDAAKAKREAAAKTKEQPDATPPAKKAARMPMKPQVSAVTAKTRLQDPVTDEGRLQVTDADGLPVTDAERLEPHGGGVDGGELPSSSSSSVGSTPPSIPAQVGRGGGTSSDNPKQKPSKAVALGVETVDQLLQEVRRIRPGWTAKSTRPTIESILAGGEPFELVALAAQYCAQDTTIRFPVVMAMPGDHWDLAAARLARQTAVDVDDEPPIHLSVAACKQCDPTGWLLKDPTSDRYDVAIPRVRCDHSVPAMAGVS